MNTDRLNNCYWCGQPATGHEHVPPKNLFPKGHRKDLLTVGACVKHNQDLSKIDERIRFHMTSVSNNELARKHFQDKSLNILKRPESNKLAYSIVTNYFRNYNGKNIQRESQQTINLYFEKIIRGLFYYHYCIILDGSTSYFSNKLELINMTADAHFYYYSIANEFNDLWKQGDAKNKDVFDYKYYFSEKEKRFFLSMTFYKEHEVIGITLPPNKTINDYGLTFEEYQERKKHWI